MPTEQAECLGFELSFNDPVTRTTKVLWLKMYLEDGTIELLEEGRGAYLKRIFCPEITLHDLYIGNKIIIYVDRYNKAMAVTAYSNTATAKHMKKLERHFVCTICNGKCSNTLVELLKLSQRFGLKLNLIQTLNSTDTIVELVGLVGNSSPFLEAVERAHLEAINVTEVKDGPGETEPYLSEPLSVPANCSLCIIKPHIIKSSQLPDILADILGAGFTIAAIKSLHLTAADGEEIFDAYKEVTPRYSDFLAHVSSGISVALMITGFQEATVSELRKLCGPPLPDIARALRPNTLRARYGVDSSMNAVHCSDICEYGKPECCFIIQFY